MVVVSGVKVTLPARAREFIPRHYNYEASYQILRFGAGLCAGLAAAPRYDNWLRSGRCLPTEFGAFSPVRLDTPIGRNQSVAQAT
jgi:hypothetical protein